MIFFYPVIAVVLLAFNVSDAKVEFTSSTMYNIFDFEGNEEIPLPRCDFGCLIFASTDGDYKDSDDGFDPYMKNLLIYDQAKDRNSSIADIAVQVQEGTSQKVPLDIAANGHYVILNLNAVEEKGNDVTVWVIERAKAHEFDYEIYDVAQMDRAPSVPSTIITIMSAKQFRVIADSGEDNSYTARLVGFDNALDNNPDQCNYAYKTPKNSPFDGFTFQVNGPIVSIVFNERRSVNLKADYNYVNVRDLAKSGFISSPGYNGCAKLGNNQAYRAKQYRYSEDYDMHGEPDNFHIVYDADVSFTDGKKVTIKDMTNNVHYFLTEEHKNFQIDIISTQLVIISYDDIKPPQSFMLRFTSTQLPRATTTDSIDHSTQEDTTVAPITTSPKFVSTTSSESTSTSPPTTSQSTSTSITPTTSGASGITDGKVDFTYSTMYSVYDFEGVAEVPLPRCNFGCLIFASTMPNYQPSDDGLEPFMNLLIYDQKNDQNQTIAELSVQLNPANSQKIPLDIMGPGTYSILNLNAPDDKGTDVTVWVIERSKAHEFDYEIYDAGTMKRPVSAPSSVITIISAMQFRVVAEPGEANSYTTRLVGFDNALENSPDKCIYAYKTNPNSKFEGFEFQINAPIFSIVFNEKKSVNLKTDYYYVNVRNLGQSGFLSSPGYNGCDLMGGAQAHRAKWTHYSDEYDLHGEPNDYSVFFDGDLDTSEGHEIDIKDMTNSQTFPIAGARAKITMTIPKTQFLIIRYSDITTPQSFMLRYTSTLLPKVMTSAPQSSSTTASATISSITLTPTTSSVGGATIASVLTCLILFIF